MLSSSIPHLPQYVRHRIRDTYGYFAASIGVTAATAVGIFRTPALLNIVARQVLINCRVLYPNLPAQFNSFLPQGIVSMVVAIAALIGTGAVVRSIPYEPGFGKKQLAWLAHCAVVGAVVAPICFLGGPILTRAAWYTAGMVGGLSTGEFILSATPFSALDQSTFLRLQWPPVPPARSS